MQTGWPALYPLASTVCYRVSCTREQVEVVNRHGVACLLEVQSSFPTCCTSTTTVIVCVPCLCDLLLFGHAVAEVVEMPWWAYGAVGMQLWFPSIVLAAMQLQSLHSSSSNTALHSQASLPAQLTPHAAVAAGLGPGTFIGGLGSRSGSGVPASLGRSGSLWSNATGPGLQAGQGGSGSMAALAAAGAAAAAAGAQPGSARAASLNMKHAQSAPALSQDGGTSAGGFQAIQYGTEIELEFDREVYPIGVSLADASIVGVTQRVMRPQQQAAATQVGCWSLPGKACLLSLGHAAAICYGCTRHSSRVTCTLPSGHAFLLGTC